VLLNQIEMMEALDELLRDKSATEDDDEHRAESGANLTESIEQTLERLKESSHQPTVTSREH
jgi:hypothetical protein